MDRFTGSLKFATELEGKYWDYMVARSHEYVGNNLTGRIILDFQKGKLNSVLDQLIIAGVSSLDFAFDKLAL